MLVTLTEEQNIAINAEITEFVKKMTEKGQSVSYYQQRRNASKAAEDIFLGKKAEYLALLGLHKAYGFPLVKPDMDIRVGSHKKWQKDLPFSEKGNFPDVNVKACSAKTYDYCDDYSWTFQYSNNDGSFGRDDIFDTSSPELVALVFVETPEAASGAIKAVLPWKIIKEHLKDPRKKSLVGIKKCIYYKDLDEDEKNNIRFHR